MEREVDFTINDLSSKCRSKIELYNLLARDGGIYLQPAQDCAQSFLRSLILGEKKYLKWENVKVTKVPQCKGLRVKEILSFAQGISDIDEYWPEYDYSKEPNRDWLWNLINSLNHKKFQKFIDIKTEERRKSIIQSQNMQITVKKEFIDIFKTSKAVSLQNGKSHFLARIPKMNKHQALLNQVNEEKKEGDVLIAKLKDIINLLNLKLEKVEQKLSENEDYTDMMAKLYELGLIDENGNTFFAV